VSAWWALVGWITLQGHMAFVKTPDGASIELLQIGDSLTPEEPWASMASVTNADGSFTW
jgi:hypothetical protein